MVALGEGRGTVTPTLWGRIQTRWFLLAVIGIPWTVFIGPGLVLFAGGADIVQVYALAFTALLLVGVLGTGWEFVYHALMQLRWEKDWPALFGLLTAINELLLLLPVLALLGFDLPFAVYIQFFTLWILMWVFSNGPMRVLLPRWRYRGGSIR